MEPSKPSPNPSNLDSQAFKLAVAVALRRYQKKKEQPQPDANLHLSNSKSEEAERWKKKAKERKRELIRLRTELEQLEDGGGGKEDQQEVCSRVVSCSCHFFDECGELWTKRIRLGVIGNGDEGEDGTVHEHWIDDVLRRRFIRYVRSNVRRKRSGSSIPCRQLIGSIAEDELERLSTSADFLVQLSDTLSMEKSTSSVAALSHLAVDFIIASVKNLLSLKKDDELVEEITNGLIMRLTKRMCNATKQDGSNSGDSDSQSCVQHLIRMLGTESYIGQHVMLLVSQRICVLAENLLMMDPFDDAFPDMHDWVFMMIQLIEFMISDNMQSWTANKDIDNRLFEEWLRSILQARKALELLECRNGLYVLYMERVTGELAKHLGPLSRQGKLNMDILSIFLC